MPVATLSPAERSIAAFERAVIKLEERFDRILQKENLRVERAEQRLLDAKSEKQAERLEGKLEETLLSAEAEKAAAAVSLEAGLAEAEAELLRDLEKDVAKIVKTVLKALERDRPISESDLIEKFDDFALAVSSGLQPDPSDIDLFLGLPVDSPALQAAAANFLDAVNDTPVVAVPLSNQSIDEDTDWVFTVPSGTFTDTYGDALTLTAAQADGSPLPDWLNFDGTSFSGTPPRDFYGALALVVTASDGSLTAEAPFTLTIEPVNDAPVLAAAIAGQVMDEDTPWSFAIPAGTFSDVDGDALTLTAAQADGSPLPEWLSFDGASFSGTPPRDFNGALALVVTASDGSLTAEAPFTLTIEPVNDAPVNTVPVAQTVDEDAPLTLAGLSVGDVDGDLSSTRLSVTNGAILVSLAGGATISNGANGSSTLTLSGTEAEINAALASLTYLGDVDFNGADVLTVVSTDSAGIPLSDTDTVAISVTPVNDLPVAVADEDIGTIVEQGFARPGNGTTTGNVLINDTDVDGTDTLIVTEVDSGTGEPGSSMTVDPVVDQVVLGRYGSLLINANGVWTYSLNDADPDTEALEDGATVFEVFTYTVSDQNDGAATASLTIAIEGSTDNVPPVAVDDTVLLDEDATIVLDLLSNDSDANNQLFVTQTLSAASINGVAATVGAVIATDHGAVTVGDAGVLTYIPALHYVGADSFTYIASDGFEESNEATVRLTVAPVDDAPVAVGETGVTRLVEAGGVANSDPGLVSASGNVLDNDSDPDIDDVGGAEVGTVTLQVASVAFGATVGAVGGVISGKYGDLTLNADGGYTYTLDPVRSDPLTAADRVSDAFAYTITDGLLTSETATLTIDIDGRNDAPEIAPESLARLGARLTGLGDDAGLPAVSGDGSTILLTTAGGRVVELYSADPAGSYTKRTLIDDDGTTDVIFTHASISADAGTIVLARQDAPTTLTILKADGAGGYARTEMAVGNAPADHVIVSVSVSADGGTIAVASRRSFDSFQTQANGYVFEADGTGGYTETLLDTSATGYRFGNASAISADGSTLVFGDIDALDTNGAAHVYRDNGAGGYDRTLLTAGESSVASRYGEAVDVSEDGSRIVVGAWNAPGGPRAGGAVYIHDSDGAGGYTTTKVFPSDWGRGFFGVSVSISADGDTIGVSSASGDYVLEPDGMGGYVETNLPQASGWVGSRSVSDDGTTFVATVYNLDAEGDFINVLTRQPDRSFADAEGTLYGPNGFVAHAPGSVVAGLVDGQAPEAGAAAATASGTLIGSDPDDEPADLTWHVATGPDQAPESVLGDTAVGTYGTITILGGVWTYTLNDEAAQALGEHQRAFDVFTVVVADPAGATDAQTVAVSVTGRNDEATIIGSDTGSVIEDFRLTTGGTLTVLDPDEGENSVAARTDIAGGYGRFSVTAAGIWSYQLNNESLLVQSLGATDTRTDTFTVTSADGTASAQIVVTITGQNEVFEQLPTFGTAFLGVRAAESGSAGFVAGDMSGYSVSGAGDVNGDGIDDFLIGAIIPLRNPDGSFDRLQDATYVMFGSDTGYDAEFDLARIENGDGSQGFIVYDIVRAVGDINDDGIDDLRVGNSAVFGSAALAAPSFDVASLAAGDGSEGVFFSGEINSANSSVRWAFNSSRVDLNGDGIDDFLYYDASGLAVVFGSATGFDPSFDVSGLATGDGSAGFVINHVPYFDQLGSSRQIDDTRLGRDGLRYLESTVSSAGDVNGDGIDDLLISMPMSDRIEQVGGLTTYIEDVGRTYVLFGSDTGFDASFNFSDIGNFDGPDGFVIIGIDRNDRSGHSVSSAGDLNGDGIDDILIGTDSQNSQEDFRGEAYVVFGSSTGFNLVTGPNVRGSVFDLEDIVNGDGSDGFVFRGIDQYDTAGYSVSTAGDANGDGIDDILISAPYASGTNPDGSIQYLTGETYLVFGTTSGFDATFDLASLGGGGGVLGVVLRGRSSSFSGSSVSFAGDVNNDGFDDFLIGADLGNGTVINANGTYLQEGSGESFIVYGGPGMIERYDLADGARDGVIELGLIGLNPNDFDLA